MVALFVFVMLGEGALAVGLMVLGYSLGRLTGYKAALRTIRLGLGTALINALNERGNTPQ